MHKPDRGETQRTGSGAKPIAGSDLRVGDLTMTADPVLSDGEQPPISPSGGTVSTTKTKRSA